MHLQFLKLKVLTKSFSNLPSSVLKLLTLVVYFCLSDWLIECTSSSICSNWKRNKKIKNHQQKNKNKERYVKTTKTTGLLKTFCMLTDISWMSYKLTNSLASSICLSVKLHKFFFSAEKREANIQWKVNSMGYSWGIKCNAYLTKDIFHTWNAPSQYHVAHMRFPLLTG